MNSILRNHIDAALTEYSQGDHFLELLHAKTEYFHLTGTVNEEDEEYESRMNCFNDWYIFQYYLKNKNSIVIKDYLRNKQLDPEITNALNSVNYSLFEYSKRNFKNQIILEDVLHDQKIMLPVNHEIVALVPKDFFIGRVLTYNDESYLLKGTCIFPMDVKSICRKQSKKIRKLKNPEAEVAFLLTLESLKTKWSRYGHIAVNKIFTFPS